MLTCFKGVIGITFGFPTHPTFIPMKLALQLVAKIMTKTEGINTHGRRNDIHHINNGENCGSKTISNANIIYNYRV